MPVKNYIGYIKINSGYDIDGINFLWL